MGHNSEQDVHVRLDSPLDKRKAILQVTIDSVQLLKRQQNLKYIRAEKLKTYAEFKKALVDIENLVKEVRFKELPLGAEALKHIKGLRQESVMKPVVRRIEKVAQKKERKVVDIQKAPIDRQLEELQRKLRSL